MRIGLSFDQGSPKYRLYLGAILAAGEQFGVPVEPVWLAGSGRQFERDAVRSIDGLLLTGGADVEPQRYGFEDRDVVCVTCEGRDEAELAVLDFAFTRRLPILAICRGMQLLNVYRGGTLVPDLTVPGHRLDDAARHLVRIESGTTLFHAVNLAEGEVTSSHHQAIAQLGRGLRVAAKHADGTVEAIEWEEPMRKPWLAAVQWHPERMGLDEPLAGPIFQGFLEAVRARAQ